MAIRLTKSNTQILVIYLLAMSSASQAQQSFNTIAPPRGDDTRQYLSFGGLAGIRWRDNADLTNGNLNQEREDRIGANIAAFQRWRKVSLSADYSAAYLFVDSESPNPQSDRSEIRGITLLGVEAIRDRLDVEFSHTRQNLLGRPGELNLRNNFVARDIISIQPNLQVMNSQKSQLVFSGVHSQVWFNNQRSTFNSIDSDLTGIRGSWTYSLTPVSGFELQVSDSTLTYKPTNADNEDFDYRVVQASYFSNLRNLNYRISTGVNAFKGPDGDTFSSPLFSAEISYSQGLTTWRGSSNLLLTDTSRGNQINRSTGLAVGDGRSDFIDQYRLFTNHISVVTVPCRRCSLEVGLNSAYEVYNLNSAQDNSSVSLQSLFGYELTSRLNLGALFLIRGQSFDGANQTTDFTTTDVGISGRYQLNDRLVLEGTFQRRLRRTGLSDNQAEYDLNEANLTMFYQFR